MPEMEQITKVSLELKSLRTIEKFVDDLCDKFLINDTYYGNILMALTETFSLCLISAKEESINISYKTDYQIVTIYLQPVKSKIITALKNNPDLEKTEGDEIAQKSFLINSLTEKIEISENNRVGLVFDISAVHNEVYKHRQKKLDDYFEQTLTKSLKKKNDKL